MSSQFTPEQIAHALLREQPSALNIQPPTYFAITVERISAIANSPLGQEFAAQWKDLSSINPKKSDAIIAGLINYRRLDLEIQDEYPGASATDTSVLKHLLNNELSSLTQ